MSSMPYTTRTWGQLAKIEFNAIKQIVESMHQIRSTIEVELGIIVSVLLVIAATKNMRNVAVLMSTVVVGECSNP